SLTPPSVHRSVGKRTSANVLPAKSKARHLTAPVLKSQPVITLLEGTHRRASLTGDGLPEHGYPRKSGIFTAPEAQSKGRFCSWRHSRQKSPEIHQGSVI